MPSRALAVFAVLAAAAVVVSAQQPNPCASPGQWEGRQERFDQNATHLMRAIAFYSYDAVNERKAHVEEVQITVGGSTSTHKYHRVALYREDIEYVLDLDTKVCTKQKPGHPFWHHDVVRNATFDGMYTIGSKAFPSSGVDVMVWRYQNTDFDWQGQFTVTGCVPVMSSVFDRRDRSYFNEAFQDVTLGLHDPNAFLPPQGC